jgi:hypothetical protein
MNETPRPATRSVRPPPEEDMYEFVNDRNVNYQDFVNEYVRALKEKAED